MAASLALKVLGLWVPYHIIVVSIFFSIILIFPKITLCSLYILGRITQGQRLSNCQTLQVFHVQSTGIKAWPQLSAIGRAAFDLFGTIVTIIPCIVVVVLAPVILDLVL